MRLVKLSLKAYKILLFLFSREQLLHQKSVALPGCQPTRNRKKENRWQLFQDQHRPLISPDSMAFFNNNLRLFHFFIN